MSARAVPALTPTAQRPVTLAEWLAFPEELGAELIDGRIVYKAQPVFDRGYCQGKLGSALNPWNRKSEGEGAGGWWIGIDVDIS